MVEEEKNQEKTEEQGSQEQPEKKPESQPEPQEQSKSEVLSVKEIDELYEDIKRAANSNSDNPDKEKELVKRAIEAERKRQADLQKQQQTEQERKEMKQKLDQALEELETLKNSSSGRKTQVPQNNPFEKTEDNKIKLPKADFDKAVMDFVKKGGKQ